MDILKTIFKEKFRRQKHNSNIEYKFSKDCLMRLVPNNRLPRRLLNVVSFFV